MCGICGIVDYRIDQAQQGELVQAMCAKMTHRGPDDEGVYVREKQAGPLVSLGHRRLKIIDLSSAGRQPISNEDGNIRLVLNGEIYNYRELRDSLQEKRHIFNSHSDSEVVVHLYEEYGTECVKYLRGMFAFAIWDNTGETLFLARDRVGKKPLLYFFNGNIFCFASEFGALIASGMVDKEVNLRAINQYLTFGYVPAPQSIYSSVFKLLPAHTLILKNRSLQVSKYWGLDYSKKIKISERDAASELLRILKEAIKIRLNSDVSLGAFLSGGIDSSAIVALMSSLTDAKVKTFSIGFSEADYNELGYARKIAEKYGTEHHEFVVKPNAMDILPLLVERYGEPYADSSCIPTYYVSRQTKKFVTVALNGDGGDELFGGYERYQAMLLAENFQKLAYPIRMMGLGLAAILPDSPDPKNKLRRLKRFVQALDLPTVNRYNRWVGIFDDSFKRKLYADDFSAGIATSKAENYLSRIFEEGAELSLLDRLLLADTITYLPNDLLVKVDITSMSCSLEARSPFLDHLLMEFAASLPVEYKIKNGIRKYILKKAIKDLVPAENIYRPKMGFGMPVSLWFRNELKGFLFDHLFSSKALSRGYFNTQTVTGMFNQHVGGKNDYSLQLWALLMLEMWHEQFID